MSRYSHQKILIGKESARTTPLLQAKPNARPEQPPLLPQVETKVQLKEAPPSQIEKRLQRAPSQQVERTGSCSDLESRFYFLPFFLLWKKIKEAMRVVRCG